MAIVSAGGTYRNDLYTGITSRQSLLSAINTTLVAAGWTSTLAKAYTTVEFTGNPANNDTITVAGQVYTFKTVIGSAYDVLIGASAFDSYFNFKSALNALAGSGTLYGGGTVANTQMEGGRMGGGGATGYLIIQKIVGGFFTSPGCTESLANAVLTYSGSITGGGYKWTSARSDQGLVMCVYGLDAQETANPPYLDVVRMVGANFEDTFLSHPYIYNSSPNNENGGFRLALGISSSWRVIANRYGFAIMGESVPKTVELAWLYAGIPYLYPPLAPVAISSVTNASPALITTQSDHGLSTGNTVCIRATGLSAIDTSLVATVVNATQFTVPVASGGTSNTGYVGKVTTPGATISECLLLAAGASSVKFGRGSLTCENGSWWSLLNGNPGGGTATTSGGGAPGFVVPVNALTDRGAAGATWYDGSSLYSEPFFGLGDNALAAFRLVGQFYSTVIILGSFSPDITGNFNSTNWYQLTDTNSGSASSAAGSVLIQVP